MTPSSGNKSGAAVRRAGTWLATAVVLVAGGCGLSAYEERVAQEQKRIEGIDEANRLLGDPVEPPPLRETNPNLPPADTSYLFFRPPWGIATKHESAPRGEVLYEYPPEGRNRPSWQRRSTQRETVFLNVFLAVAPSMSAADGWNEFAAKVWRALPNPDPGGYVEVPIQPPDRPVMKFLSHSFTEPAPEPNKPATIYRAYFLYRDTPDYVAIVYHLPQDQINNAEVAKTIDYSLQSLTVRPDAAAKLSQWQRNHPKK